MEYWDRRPCNVNHSTAALGTEQYFREVAQRRYFVEPHIRPFLHRATRGVARVVEAGCGIGTDARYMLQTGLCMQYVGVDQSVRSVDLARDNLRHLGLPQGVAQVWCAPIDSFSPPHRAGLVYSFGVLHHLLDPVGALRHMRSWIVPDGKLALMVYARVSSKNLRLTRGRVWREDLTARGSEAQPDAPVTHTYTRGTLTELLEAARFEPEYMEKTHIFPYRTAQYVQHQYVRGFPWNIVPPQWLAPLLGWHWLVIARKR